jgi:hypothetical protein
MAGVAIQHGSRLSHKTRLQELDRELDAARPGNVRLIRRLAAAASVLILIAAGAHFYAHHTYAHAALAESFYTPVQTEVFRGSDVEKSSATIAFAQAQQFFRAESYDNAIEQYLLIIQANDLQKDKAEWNLLMCYLAKDPKGSQFRVLMDHISNNPEHTFYHKSQELQRTMHGTLYRIVNR